MAEEPRESNGSAAGDIAETLRLIAAEQKLPAEYKTQPSLLIRRIHQGFVASGGKYLGKSRNSINQIRRLLEQTDIQIKSIQPKITGSTRIDKKDAYNLLYVFLKHWNFIGERNNSNPSKDDYEPILEERHIEKIIDVILKSTFDLPNKRKIILPTSKKSPGNRIDVEASIDIFSEIIPYINTLVTISSNRTILAPDPITGIDAFSRLMDHLWRIGKDEERCLIWAVDIGDRKFGDFLSATNFFNVDFLAMQFRMLSLYNDSSASDRWDWLSKSAAFLVGGLRPDEIDCIYAASDVSTNTKQNRWPYLGAQHVLFSAIPDRWAAAPQLRSVYGGHLEELDKRTFVVFRGGSAATDAPTEAEEASLRYFAFGPNREVWNSENPIATKQSVAKAIELPSPEPRYDEAVDVLCAACYSRCNLSELLGTVDIDPIEALAQLRRMGFAVMTLNEFLILNTFIQ